MVKIFIDTHKSYFFSLNFAWQCELDVKLKLHLIFFVSLDNLKKRRPSTCRWQRRDWLKSGWKLIAIDRACEDITYLHKVNRLVKILLICIRSTGLWRYYLFTLGQQARSTIWFACLLYKYHPYSGAVILSPTFN